MISLQDLFILILFVAALAIGWLLGSRERKKTERANGSEPVYFAGLNYLLKEETHEAIDSLVSVLEHGTDSMDAHLVLAHMLRRRGDVERAIQIHQKLLANPALTPVEINRINLELARDYTSVGLYDRAESLLLKELESEAGDKKASFEYLLEIYQETKEWARAIEVSERIIGRSGTFWRNLWPRPKYLERRLKQSVAHFHCELAVEKLASAEVRAAKKHLKRALSVDSQSVRANLQLAQLFMDGREYQAALKCLDVVRAQDAALFPEALPLIVTCYKQLSDEKGLFDYLTKAMLELPSSAVAILLAQIITDQDGVDAGIRFFVNERDVRSLRELEPLLTLMAQDGDAAISCVHEAVSALFQRSHSYRCDNCGFAGESLHWHCPSCKEWGAIKPSFELDAALKTTTSELQA